MPRTADTSPREPELARRAEEFRAAAARSRRLAAGLSGDRLAWRPAPDRWSVAECLEHLVRTGEVYLQVLDRVIEEGREAGALADGPFRHGLVDRWLVRFLEPPPGLGIPAPRIIDPRRPPGSSGAATAGSVAPADGSPPLPRFVALQDRLVKRVKAADGLDLSGLRVRSPFVPLLGMDLGTAFAVVAAHQRRHLWQAERVVADEGFPGG